MAALRCSSCGQGISEFDSRCAACGAASPEATGAASAGATVFDGTPPPRADPARPTSPAEEPFVSRQVSHYRLLRPLGRGGMGVVYLAQDVELGREVAVKFLHHRSEARPADEARFRREAQAAASLDHPNIGTIYEVGEHAGRRFLAMAYYDGTTLAQLLAGRPDKRLAVPEAAAIAGQLASALAAAHAAGIVHRDLKPENVMVLPDGRVKLLDFGLARWVDSGGVTEEGMAVGTAAYMAPEQIKGLRTGTAADLWALGVVLYQMLAGRRAFGGERQGMVHSILHEDPQPLREGNADVPAVLETIVARCLAKEPPERPSAAAVVAELQASGLWAVSGSSAAVSAPHRRSRRAWALAGTAAVLLVLAVSVWRLTRKPAPTVYVAVLKPEVSGTLLPDDAAQVKLNLQDALLRAVAALDGLAALDTAQVNAVRGTPVEIARAVAAGEVVASQADCAGDLCQVSLRRLDGRDGRVLWSAPLRLPFSDPRLFANAVAVSLRQGYAEHGLRGPRLELKISEEDYRTFLALRARLAASGDFAEILTRLGELRQRTSPFLDACVLEAKVARKLYLDTGAPRYLERGLAVAQEARRIAPDDYQPLDILFLLNLDSGKLDEAERLLARMEELDPAGSLLRRGQLAEKRGQPEEALRQMAEAVRLRPSWQTLLTLALAEHRQGRLDEARRHLEQLLERFPGNVEGLQTLAQLELLRNPDRAISLFREAARRDPSPNTLTNLGAGLLLVRRYGEAEQSLREALRLQPDDPSARLNLADCLTLAGRKAEGQELYLRIVEDPRTLAAGNWRLFSVRAQALAHLGQTVQAVEIIQQALRMTPDNAQLALDAAVVYVVIGDRGSALFHARQAASHGVGPQWFALPFFDPLRGEPTFQALTLSRQSVR